MKRRRSGYCADNALTVVDQDRAGDLDFDRPGEGSLRHAIAGARLQRKHRVVAGRTGVKQVSRTEIGLIARKREGFRRAAQSRVKKCRGVEGQQHRYRTASDSRKDRRGRRVQLHQRRCCARIERGQPALAGECEDGRDSGPGVDLGSELIERGAPFDPDRRNGRGAKFVGYGDDRSGKKETQRCQQPSGCPDSFRTQCVAPKRQCVPRPLIPD